MKFSTAFILLVLVSARAFAIAPEITDQDPLSTPEEMALTITLNDLTVTDPDSVFPDDFTLTVQDGSNYTRVGNTITPALDFNGDLTVPVTVNDGTDDSPVFNLTVSVTGVNDQPIITGQDPLSTPEETALTITLNDLTVTDPDDTYPADFTLSVQDGSNYSRSGNTITPATNFSGDLTVPVTVNDGTTNSPVFNLTVSVTGVNDQPVITGQDPLSTPEETALTITLNDLTVTDSDNSYPADFTLAVQNGSNYSRSGNTITPATNFNGDLTVPVTVTDNSGEGNATSAPFNLTVSVTAVNDQPVITGQDPLSTPEETALTITLNDLTVTDSDNTYPADFTLSVQDGSNYSRSGNTITPATNFSGDLTVPVTVNDGTTNSPVFNLTVSVTGVNDQPVITGQDPLSTPEETALTITLNDLTVTDSDNSYPADFTLAVQNGSNYSRSGNTITPASNFNGDLTVPVTVTDNSGEGNATSAPFNLTVSVTAVNDQPVITGQDPLSTPEETALTITLNDLTVTDPDDTYPADFTLSVQDGSNYSRSGNTITPATNFSGDLTVPVTVNDGTTNSPVFNLTVSVTGVNDQPVITGQDPLSTPEETALTITLNDLTVTDSDNSYPADFTLAVQNGSNYSRSGNTITPATNFNGDLTVPVTVTDNSGEGNATSAPFNLTVTVTAVNDQPVITGQDPLSTPEETALTITLNDLTVTDSDNTYPADFTLSVQDGSNYSRSGNTITPATNFSGDLTVPVTVNDGTTNSPVFNLTVSVTGVNDQPVITGQDPLSTPEETALTITLNDLTVTDSDNSYPADFTLAVQNGSNYSRSGNTITPASNFNGDLTVPVTVTDNSGEGNATSAPFNLTVSVTAVNDQPVITGQDPLSTPEETALTITLNDLTVTDPDDTYPADFSLTVQNGTNYSRSGNTITPATNFNGDLTVPVTVNDGTTNSPVFNLTVSVTGVNDQPVITGQDPLSTPEETALTITLNDLTVTDSDNSYPADFTLAVQNGSNYSRSGNTITPATNFNGDLTVAVTVNDGTTSSPVFNLTVSVTAVNDQPVITGQDPLSTPEEMALTITLNDLTVTDSDNTYPADFTLAVQNGSNYSRSGNTITPATNFSGDLTVPVTVNDGTTNSPVFNLTVSVTGVNDQPVITGQDPLSTPEETALTITLNDLTVTDPDDTYPADFTLAVQNGSNYSRSGNTITPATNFNGDLTVAVTVNDGTTNSPVFNLTVSVTAVNDQPVITGQDPLSTPEETALTITLNDLTVTDPDDTYPADFTLSVQNGSNYSRSGNTITPATNFNGDLTVAVTVNDGTDTSSVFNLNVTVSAVNDQPVITGQDPLSTPEETALTITLNDLTVTDPDDTYPADFTLSVQDGSNYGRSGNTITPASNFNGDLTVPVTVNDGTTNSPVFNLTVSVTGINDQPVITGQGTINTLEITAREILLTDLIVTDPDNAYPADFTLAVQDGADYTRVGNTITPAIDFNGDLTVPVTVNDGTTNSPVFNLTVGVIAVNNQPQIISQLLLSTPEDTALTITLTDLSVVDADSVFPDDFTLAVQDGADYTRVDNTITPVSDFNGILAVPVTVNDGTDTSPVFNLTVTVTAVNDQPVITGQNVVTTPEITEREILLTDLLVTDPDNTYPADFTLAVQDGVDYTRVGNVITPDTDFNGDLSVPVTVTDNSGEANATSAVFNLIVSVSAVNNQPVITAQLPLTTLEDTALTITLADLTVTDADSTYPDDFTLTVLDGTDYTRVDNTITPALDFNGDLTVPVTVNDGEADSAVFNLVVTVTPVNDAPVIVGQVVLATPEDTSLTVVITDVTVTDPDNLFPDDFTLELFDGTNYTRAGNAITPDLNFNGPLSVPATVSDGELTSAQFILTIDVSAENDQPVLETPIEDQLAIEGTAFTLDVSGNFTDADGDSLQFTAVNLPASGNLVFDPVTGIISGTPQVEDARDTDPYIIIITATDGDPDTIAATDEFNLNISALDRANVSLEIAVAPDPAMLNDELSWTFTASNLVGPQIATNVGLNGSFVGTGLSISSTSSCTIQATVDQVTEFDCTIGSLAIGEAISVVLTTVTSTVGDVVAFATAANIDPLPLDPNLVDNSRQVAVGVAEEFSNGAVEVLGNVSVLSMAAGDVNSDGAEDLVVGTVAGQPIQIYLSDGFRDFVTPPISLPDTSANEGVALADFDNNGTLDLVVANGGGQPDVVYSNDGVGNFTLVADLDSAASTGGAEGNFAINGLPAPTSSHDVAVADFNSDGNMDIVIATIEGNPVYLGDGFGAFSPYAILGLADSHAIAVGDFDGTAGPDIVFANVGSDSEVWLNNGVDGFTVGDSLPIGDAVSVTVGEFGGGVGLDLAFGRVPTVNGDVPANPVLINNGSGSFGTPVALLGTSATNDILAGDVNSDGLTDLVFINTSGVHQIWTATGSGFELHSEQIVDGGALVGVLTELGFTDVDDPGGVDLALGGALQVGTSVYLNDGFGNLGLGDAVPPVLSLNGAASVEVPANSNYVDAGAIAEDNIDGDISSSVIVTSNVNTAIVGSYTVTYNVTDFAGNSATAISRTVTVAPAAGAGGGGGGGGAAGPLLLLLLMFAACLTAWRANRAIIRVAAKNQNQRGPGNV